MARTLIVRFDIADVANPVEPGKTISMDRFTFNPPENAAVETELEAGGRRFHVRGRIHKLGQNYFGIDWETPTLLE